jgi:hypothetical protein|tara:strand:+ start:672 stop:1073 length:402 start_codon:yes stop_codon:yes gene_type:complete
MNMNDSLDTVKTISIRGKQYVTVAERLRQLHLSVSNDMPGPSIDTKIVYAEGGVYIVKATVIPDVTQPDCFFTGHAKEDESKGQINGTSALENCETSAIGRALGNAGYGSAESIASANEVMNAMHQQNTKKES